MNKKKLFALCVTLILMTVVIGVAFAEENQEHEYTVTVSYKMKNGQLGSVTYTIWAASASDAQKVAQEKCEYEKESYVVSCGAATATGRSR